jgi:hypothetical protein
VPIRAFNAKPTSLGLDTRSLEQMPRYVRPTSANHCFPDLYPRSWFPTCLGYPRKGRCDRRVRRFTTRWTRFGGSCGDEERYSPSHVVSFVLSHHVVARSTHDFASDISSPCRSRFRLCRSACVMTTGSRPLPRPLVKGAACHDPRCLPSSRHPFSPGAAPLAHLATRLSCPPLAICPDLLSRSRSRRCSMPKCAT